MLLGFKTQLKVNRQQRLLLAQHAGVARHAWNSGLALCQQVLLHNKLHSDDRIKFPTAIDLHKWLVAAIKSTHPWYYEVRMVVSFELFPPAAPRRPEEQRREYVTRHNSN
jgi:putative transposase